MIIPRPSRNAEDSLLRRVVLASLEDDKAEDIAVVDLKGKTSFADAMVVATGRSQRHISALADHLEKALKSAGQRRVNVEGKEQCNWVLIDAGDIVVHLFKPETRALYNLEKMWSITMPARELALS